MPESPGNKNTQPNRRKNAVVNELCSGNNQGWENHMYRFMLIDDEPEIREGLQEVVHFDELGFSLVGEAANGVEGLRLAELLRPDLIITDIRMPLMDGLTMAAQIKKVLPTVQFIILSGYDEFEYARQAIEITALRYLLKPISSVEFIAVMEDVKKRMDDAFAQRRDLSRLRAHFASSLPLLREQLLSSLLMGNMDSREALETASRYGVDLASHSYSVAMIRLQPETQPRGLDAIGSPELLSFAIANVTEEILSAHVKHHLFHHEGMLSVLLCLEGQPDDLARVANAMEEVRQNVEHYLGSVVIIGIGTRCDSLSALPACTRQAYSALNHASLMEGGQVLSITDMVPRSENTLSIDEYTLRVLGNSLKLGDAAKAADTVDALLLACRNRLATLLEYRAFLLEILMVFIRVGRDLDMGSPEDVQQDVLDALLKCPPIPEATRIFKALCVRFTAAVADSRASSSLSLARDAVDYIRRHYAEADLTVDKLCGHLHISTSYFSALFKKETRKTFLQYITELRMDKAMTLLASGELRTAEVAVRVGISDPSYFSYSFKRHFGVSPSHVRSNKGMGK